jgi:nucleotide-binding universal stress UspA family protein
MKTTGFTGPATPGGILVPLDGSEFSECALPYAAAIASRARTALQVVHVHETSFSLISDMAAPGFDLLAERAMRQAQCDYLLHITRQSISDVPVRAFLLEGETALALASHTKDQGIGLIVMTTDRPDRNDNARQGRSQSGMARQRRRQSGAECCRSASAAAAAVEGRQ